MLRTCFTLALALLLTAPAWAQYGHGCGAYVDPGALGQQTEAVIDDQGIVHLRRTDVYRVCEVLYETAERTRTVITDGVAREEVYTVAVPIMISKNVANKFQTRVPLNKIEAFTMAGKPVPAEGLKQALDKVATVLLATRKVPGYYLSVYKPDTLLLVIEPQNVYSVAAPGYSEAPIAGAAIAPPTPNETPAQPVDVAPVPSPAPAPAPAAIPAPAAAPQPIPGMAPRVIMAKSANDTLVLRTFLKDVATQTAYREVQSGNVKKKVPFSFETISITNVEAKYPQDAVRVYRADGKPVTAAEIAKLLSSDRGVLLSGDGENIDPAYLKIVQPDTLIIVAPIPNPPMPAPLPEGAAPPAPLSA